jgi:hypothetical protein
MALRYASPIKPLNLPAHQFYRLAALPICVHSLELRPIKLDELPVNRRCWLYSSLSITVGMSGLEPLISILSYG